MNVQPVVKKVTHVLEPVYIRGCPTPKPEWVACDDRQGDVFYSTGPHGHLHTANARKRILEKNEVE